MSSVEFQNEVFVPYRVCPLGAHIDHQLGIVTGFAINMGITMKYNKTFDGSFNVSSDLFSEVLDFNISDLPKKNNTWEDYLVASISSLKDSYDIKYGFKGEICKSIPIGGLASSSAVIICYILALCKVNDITLERRELVDLEVRAEKVYLGTKIGTLDPSSEIYSRHDALLYLDTLDNSYKLLKSKKKINFKICLVFSGLTRRLTNTFYNVNVDECKSVAFTLNYILGNSKIEFRDAYLRNYSYDDFKNNINSFPTDFIKRATHFYSEMDRVKVGTNYFKNGDLVNFGKCIFASGDSSINNYETGSLQLSTIHKLMKEINGVYGGRFSGAGYNGYYMALIDPKYEDEIKTEITSKYLEIYPQYKNDFKVFMCDIRDGVDL